MGRVNSTDTPHRRPHPLDDHDSYQKAFARLLRDLKDEMPLESLARDSFQMEMRPAYSRVMASPDIHQLHKNCVERLKDLIIEANRTCSLLNAITKFPIALEVWQSALEQRVRENDAHSQYQQARERLFAAMPGTCC